MTAHILTGGEMTTGRRKPSDLVAEYEAKVASAPAALSQFLASQDDVRMSSTIGGTWGNRTLDTGRLDGRWDDLPVGSFRDSGTNINTTVLTIRR